MVIIKGKKLFTIPGWIRGGTSTRFPNLENASAGGTTIGNKIFMIDGCDKKYTANSNAIEGEIIEEP